MKDNSSNIFYVYGYIRLDTNTYFYIGKGKGNRCYRFFDKSNHFMNIINKTECAIEILYNNLSEKDAYKKEEEVIDDLVFNEGYSIDINGLNDIYVCHLTNRQLGGNGGKAGTKISEEHKLKLKIINTGENNPFYNKKHSDKTKELIRKIRTGTKQSPETIAKYNRKGKLNNMYGRRGVKSPHYGKHRTEECKYKIAESNGTKIRCIELNRNFISLNQAEKILFEEYNIKINRKTLVNRLKPNSKKDWCGILIKDNKQIKLHWKYI